jgi:hypothetical protein
MMNLLRVTIFRHLRNETQGFVFQMTKSCITAKSKKNPKLNRLNLPIPVLILQISVGTFYI